MITSSNFFQKTLFNPNEEQFVSNRYLGPWEESRHPTIDVVKRNYESPFRREQLRSIRRKKTQFPIKLPVVAFSKMLTIDPIQPVQSQSYHMKKRGSPFTKHEEEPLTSRSLDLRQKKERRIFHNSLHQKIALPLELEQIRNKNKNIFKIIGLPTTYMYP